MLSLENISKHYIKDQTTIRALDAVSMDINKGEFVAIHGASGCGKTTLLLIAGTLLHPDQGRVIFEDREIGALGGDGSATVRANNIGFVFQQYHLIPYLNVLDNIQLPVLAQKAKVSNGRMSLLVESLGLGDRLNHTPGELSAGEKQRTALARALLFEPKLLLADEITGNLDHANAAIVMDCLADYTKSGGTVLLVTHDREAGRYADRVLQMDEGTLVDRVV